ncbi:MAG TPA: type I methionyl aminopeptidase, partial [Clostridiales bacterium]|nr:type I methionyl aminopeptidase [Clostridiales bacterium]
QSFFEGLKFARQGYRVSDIGHAIQEYVEKHGYSVVRAYVGHGVGADLHEEPEVPNYGAPGHGPRLIKGMTLAIEPMVNVGGYDIRMLDNEWTVVTKDGSLSAHYENTVLITDGEPEILTMAADL